MQIFELTAERHLLPITDGSPSPDWLRDETVRWVACVGSSVDDVKAVCRSSGVELPPQVLANLENPPQHPTVIGLEKMLFISAAVESRDSEKQGFVVCAPTTILSFHDSTNLVDAVVRNCQSERRVRAATPLAILVELIEAAMDTLSARIFRLRRKLVMLSDEMESNTRSLDPEEHLALKQETTALEIQLEDHLYCTAEMVKFDSESVDAKLLRPLLAQLQAGLARGLEAVGRLKSRITDLHQFQVRQSDETTNRRLKVLTVLSAIYLPATLIAGIYGMNFNDIPIVGMSHGYAVVIALMLIVVIGQLVFFYKRGWFK